MNRTQIYLPKSQHDTLRKLAQERRETVSETVRILLKHQLERVWPLERFHQKRQTFFEVLKEIKRLNESGPKDLAENLDKYLYGKR